MKYSVSCFLVITVLCGGAIADVSLNVDSAPNVYGSSDWDPWWTQAKSDVSGGSFTNMRTGTYPGTLLADPYDEIVYSTGDLGKRLHWIYWVPNSTIAELEGKFEARFVIDWAGTDYTYNWGAGGWDTDLSTGWIEPGSWEEYNGGVIGSFGHAWWATDNDAPPGDTGGNPYDETDQADIDALRESVLASQTYATGYVRYKDTDNDPWQYSELKVNIVPVPGAVLLGMLGLGMAGRKLRKYA